MAFWCPNVGDVYTARLSKRFRRVVALMDRYVIYDRGADKHGRCNVYTFRRWVRVRGATLTHKGRGER